MGVGVYVVLEEQIEGIDPALAGDGKSMARNLDNLDQLANEAGVARVSEFVSFNPEELAAFLEDELGQADGVDIPGEKWFDAGEGLRTITKLLSKLPALGLAEKETAPISQDLHALQQVLIAADKRKIRFHLSMDTP